MGLPHISPYSYSLVYGTEAVLPIEIEMHSLRTAIEHQIAEADWVQSRYDQLTLLDKRRLKAVDHVQVYLRKMARAYKKRVKQRRFQVGDLVLRVLRGLVIDLYRKFRPKWSKPYIIVEMTLEGSIWLMDLDENRFSELTNVNQLKKFYV